MHIVFTDLDGTLLDAETYSWEPARPALELLAAQAVPWVMVSSKTRAEMEELRAELHHAHPYVVENGAAAFIPLGYFGGPVPDAVIRDGYEVLEWGTPYPRLAAALQSLAKDTRCPVQGFQSM